MASGMVFADDIRREMLRLAEQRGKSSFFYDIEVARIVGRENWKDLIEQVRFVAEILVREGKIKLITPASHANDLRRSTRVRFAKS